MSPTVMRGFSDVYGSCSTIWMSRRDLRICWPEILEMSFPLTRITPDVGRSSPTRSLARVDLPQPDSPTTPSVSPLWSLRLTPSTAWTAPMRLWKTMPLVIGKCLTRSRVSSTTSLTVEHLLPEVAGALSIGGDDELLRRRVSPADILREPAARVERTARWDVRQIRWETLDHTELLTLEVQPRDRLQQG